MVSPHTEEFRRAVAIRAGAAGSNVAAAEAGVSRSTALKWAHEFGIELPGWSKRRLSNRFWEFVDKSGDCWLWLRSKDALGYGSRITYQGKSWAPHQIAYMMENGPIPAGLVINHICRVTSCVRPDHLEAVTQARNMQHAHQQTHCVRGHLLPERIPGRRRRCQRCLAENQRHLQARRAAGLPAIRVSAGRNIERADDGSLIGWEQPIVTMAGEELGVLWVEPGPPLKITLRVKGDTSPDALRTAPTQATEVGRDQP